MKNLNLMEIKQNLNGEIDYNYSTVIIEWKKTFKGAEKIEIDCDYAHGYYIYVDNATEPIFASARKEKCVFTILNYIVKHQSHIKSIEVKV